MSDQKNPGHNSKRDFLKNPVEHIDITSFDSRTIISSMEKMSFVSRYKWHFLHWRNNCSRVKWSNIYMFDRIF